MFVGHYGPSFAIKSVRREMPLWLLFVAVQLLDFGWSTLVTEAIHRNPVKAWCTTQVSRYLPGGIWAWPISLPASNHSESTSSTLPDPNCGRQSPPVPIFGMRTQAAIETTATLDAGPVPRTVQIASEHSPVGSSVWVVGSVYLGRGFRLMAAESGLIGASIRA